MNEERDGRLAQVFAAGTTVRDPQVRAILLRNDAPPALLAQQARPGAPDVERRVALYTLLYKDVMRGRYASFAADFGAVGPRSRRLRRARSTRPDWSPISRCAPGPAARTAMSARRCGDAGQGAGRRAAATRTTSTAWATSSGSTASMAMR